MFDTLLKIILLSSTLAYANGVALPKFDLIFFQLSMLCLLVAGAAIKPKRTFHSDLVPALFVISGVSVFFSQFNIVCLSSFLNLALGLLGMVTIATHCENPKKCERFIVYAALAHIFVYVIQKFGWSPIFNFEITKGEEGGVMGNASRLSTYLAIAMPFFLEITGVSIFIFGLIGFFNRELGILAVIASVGFMQAYQWKPSKWLYVFFALMFAGAVYVMRDTLFNISLANRLPIWKCTIEQIFDNPYTGWGLTNRPLVTSAYHNIVNQKPDFIFSSYLQFIFSVGLSGAAWIIFCWKEFKERFDYSPEAYSVLAILVLSIFKYPIEIHRIWITMIAVIAFFLIRTTKEAVPCS